MSSTIPMERTKNEVANSTTIVESLRNASPPSRFLKMNITNDGKWDDIGDVKAIEKKS